MKTMFGLVRGAALSRGAAAPARKLRRLNMVFFTVREFALHINPVRIEFPIALSARFE